MNVKKAEGLRVITWFDMHQHAGFVPDTAVFAQGLSDLGVISLCVTVTPGEYRKMHKIAASVDGLYVGVGLHPWWVADGRCGTNDLKCAQAIVRDIALNGGTRIVGEIGLDFSKKWVQVPEGCDPFAGQINACRGMFEATRMPGFAGALDEDQASGAVYTNANRPWVFSLHSVKADDALLNIVQEHLSAVQGRGDIVILHSFCGSSQQLIRARELGCYFSIGQRMLRTKKGREYVKVIPVNRMLLETDLPSEAGICLTSHQIVDALRKTCETIENIRGHEVAEQIMTTSAWVLEQAQ